MDVTELKLEYRRMVSDGNYGNETIGVQLTATLAAGEDAAAALAALVDQARGVATAELKRSPSEGVRYSLETPAEREARYAREAAERHAPPPDAARAPYTAGTSGAA